MGARRVYASRRLPGMRQKKKKKRNWQRVKHFAVASLRIIPKSRHRVESRNDPSGGPAGGPAFRYKTAKNIYRGNSQSLVITLPPPPHPHLLHRETSIPTTILSTRMFRGLFLSFFLSHLPPFLSSSLSSFFFVPRRRVHTHIAENYILSVVKGTS